MTKWGKIVTITGIGAILLEIFQIVAGEKAEKEMISEMVDEKIKSVGTPIVLNREQRRKLEKGR